MTILEAVKQLSQLIAEGKGDYDLEGSTCDGATYIVDKMEVCDKFKYICLTNEEGE